MATSAAPRPRAPLSRTPSWIMLGVVLGGLGWELTREKLLPSARPVALVTDAAPERAAPTPTPTPAPPSAHLSMEQIEGIFFQYSTKAIWENDLTEVAFWNPATGKYGDLMEVTRLAGNFYFRPLTQLTRPLADYDVDDRWPIRFTEPAHLREKRLQVIPALFRPTPPKLNP